MQYPEHLPEPEQQNEVHTHSLVRLAHNTIQLKGLEKNGEKNKLNSELSVE